MSSGQDGSRDTIGSPARRRWGLPPGATVLVVWAGLMAADLWLVASGVCNCPIEDEWPIVPCVTGHEALTPAWLWRQHNEHRLPLPRLVQVIVLGLSGRDYRVMPFVNVAILGAAALGCIAVAARLRGRSTLADIVFPLLLLSWANADDLVWGWQVQYVLSVALLTGFALATMTARPGWAGVCAVGAALCGAQGLVPAVLLAPWLLGRRRWVAALLVMVLAALYPVGLVSVGNPLSASARQFGAAAAEFLALGFGGGLPAGKAAGLTAWGWLGLALVPVALAGLTVAWRRQTGLALVIAGVLATGLAVAFGRSGVGPGLHAAPRFAILPVPLWVATYFACLPQRPRCQVALAGLALVMAACALLPGWSVARRRQAEGQGVLADVKAGMTAAQIADRATAGPHACYPRNQRPYLEQWVRMLWFPKRGHSSFSSTEKMNVPFLGASLLLPAANQKVGQRADEVVMLPEPWH